MATQGVALEPVWRLKDLAMRPERSCLHQPTYTPEEEKWAQKENTTQKKEGWWSLLDRRPILSAAIGGQLVTQIHKTTHQAFTKASEFLRPRYYISQLDLLVKERVCSCPVCAQVNPKGREEPLKEHMLMDPHLGKYWELDFTEVDPTVLGYKYLLVFVNTFSGRVMEAFQLWQPP